MSNKEKRLIPFSNCTVIDIPQDPCSTEAELSGGMWRMEDGGPAVKCPECCKPVERYPVSDDGIIRLRCGCGLQKPIKLVGFKSGACAS